MKELVNTRIQQVVLEAIDPLLLVEHAVAAAEHRRFRRRAEGEADARLEVVLVDRMRVRGSSKNGFHSSVIGEMWTS